ncbi:Scr1 family TA system antitoxin-like transcriptional regulator [Kitasatospora cineracea]
MVNNVLAFRRPEPEPPGSWGMPALQLAVELKVLRGLRTQSDVRKACKIPISGSVYSRIERGEIRIDKPHVIEVLLEALGVPKGPRRQRLLELAEAASKPGWAKRFLQPDSVPETMLRLTALEDCAVRQIVIEPNVVSGVLQTPAYRELITHETLLRSQRTHADRVIEVRGERAQRFEQRRWVHSTFVLQRGALYADFGRPEVMVEQLRALLRMVDDERMPVMIRVAPQAMLLRLQAATLIRLSFPQADFAAPDVIYVDTAGRSEFYRGFAEGEPPSDEYLDYQELVDGIIKTAPGLRESREEIVAALRRYGVQAP